VQEGSGDTGKAESFAPRGSSDTGHRVNNGRKRRSGDRLSWSMKELSRRFLSDNLKLRTGKELFLKTFVAVKS
jgi:hypothetical protein